MFNKETEYALRALVYIQHKNILGQKPILPEISKEIEAPHFFIAKILQKIAKHGFIESTKGKGGGFYLNQEMAGRPIKTIIEFLEGDQIFKSCGFGFLNCDITNPCPFHDKFGAIRDSILQLVTTETIESLAIRYKHNANILQGSYQI